MMLLADTRSYMKSFIEKGRLFSPCFGVVYDPWFCLEYRLGKLFHAVDIKEAPPKAILKRWIATFEAAAASRKVGSVYSRDALSFKASSTFSVLKFLIVTIMGQLMS